MKSKDGITDSMDMNLGELWELVMNREAWRTAIHWVAKSWTRLSDWTETGFQVLCSPSLEKKILRLREVQGLLRPRSRGEDAKKFRESGFEPGSSKASFFTAAFKKDTERENLEGWRRELLCCSWTWSSTRAGSKGLLPLGPRPLGLGQRCRSATGCPLAGAGGSQGPVWYRTAADVDVLKTNAEIRSPGDAPRGSVSRRGRAQP